MNLPAEPGQGKLLLGLGFPVHQWINLIRLAVPIAAVPHSFGVGGNVLEWLYDRRRC